MSRSRLVVPSDLNGDAVPGLFQSMSNSALAGLLGQLLLPPPLVLHTQLLLPLPPLLPLHMQLLLPLPPLLPLHMQLLLPLPPLLPLHMQLLLPLPPLLPLQLLMLPIATPATVSALKSGGAAPNRLTKPMLKTA